MTCDVGVNHLHLIDVDIGYFDSQFRLDPPLRSERDREAIRVALADGTIDAICSDHTPVDDDEKLLPFGEATPGATSRAAAVADAEVGRRDAYAARAGAAPHHVRTGRRAEAAGRPLTEGGAADCACSTRARTGASSRGR